MKKLQRFFAVIITLLSLFIAMTIIYRSGYFTECYELIGSLFNTAQDIAYSYSGNYENLDGSGSLIEDSEVESLNDSKIDGSDYTFDTLYYPYYGMLSTSEKEVYAQVYANAIAYEDSFVPVSQVSVEDVIDIMEAVYSDHPELFYLSTKYGYLYTSADNCVQITLKYNDLINDISSSTASFENVANQIINAASELSSDYEKEKYVHDAIAKICNYNENSSLSQSAYSTLVNGSSVCAGYSRAFQYIMTKLNIPTYFVTGTATGNHAWNMVKLDDGYYNVDLTWDDQDEGIIYNYFNLSDADFSSTHTRTNLAVNLPECNGLAYSNLEEISDEENISNTQKNTNIEPEIPESLVTKENTTTETIPEKEGESTDTPNKSSSHENAPVSGIPNNAIRDNKQIEAPNTQNAGNNKMQIPVSPSRP
ncbi:transglutaminase domain-containing protein [Butyrivibrio sp.]|uniref:transglutaminase domain-containing protein n=1 Tax=Butyrivibrio sp. TaxID=28121 RepID=UPI0025B8948C|nr:transglutaminase domain-containing protein [Butyrivibrio sp.]MBQ9303278.1 hypothetical protein [Butyrivibrio sp.]